jgi:DNA ligase (NAD+)
MCPSRVYGRLQKFINVLDLKGAGIETLRGMVNLGLIKTAGDLFDITEEQFCKLERKGEKHYAKFRQGLEIARNLRPAQIFASLDIEGEGTWDAICAVPGLQTPEQIMEAVDGNKIYLLANAVRVSPEKATKIIKEIRDRKQEVESLISKITVKKTGTKLLGKTFVLTGSLSKPRPKITEAIKEAGGTVSSSISIKTNYLVTDDPNSESAKSRKAKTLGIKVISENDLNLMFG